LHQIVDFSFHNTSIQEHTILTKLTVFQTVIAKVDARSCVKTVFSLSWS